MNKIVVATLISSSFVVVVLLLYFGLTIGEENENYKKNNILKLFREN